MRRARAGARTRRNQLLCAVIGCLNPPSEAFIPDKLKTALCPASADSASSLFLTPQPHYVIGLDRAGARAENSNVLSLLGAPGGCRPPLPPWPPYPLPAGTPSTPPPP
ncbi:unnamed protein product, partial [Iphiclides podalirius]